MSLKSPLTNSTNVALTDELDCERIINLYKRELDLDVSGYFEGKDSVKIYECLDTGYRFYYPFDLSGNHQLYAQLQKVPGYYCEGKWEHQIAESFIKANDLVLEVGCARGEFLESQQRKGAICTGLEFNPEAWRVAAAKGLSMPDQTLDEHAQTCAGKYDVVCAFQVVEHIGAVKEFIDACLTLLKPSGFFIIGVPNNNPYLFKYDKYHTLNMPPHHMGLWDKKSLFQLQPFFNIEVQRLFVEPLQPGDCQFYYGLQIERLKTRAERFGRVLDRALRPFSNRLLRVARHFIPGRNLLAVYTKH